MDGGRHDICITPTQVRRARAPAVLLPTARGPMQGTTMAAGIVRAGVTLCQAVQLRGAVGVSHHACGWATGGL